jgi:hypothetical protein
MRTTRNAARSALLFGGVLAFAASALAAGNGNKLVWRRIGGITVPSGIVGRHADGTPCDVGIDCVEGTPGSWMTTNGSAEVNLGTGKVEFSVEGLVLSADPSFSNIGTTSVITMVKGTLVCNDTQPGSAELVDTDAVPLSPLGNARFRGHVDLPASCTAEPGDIVFLIRIADVSDPDHANLIDLWNGFGAIRTGSDGE